MLCCRHMRTPVDVTLDSTAASLRAEIYLNNFCNGFDPVPSGDFRDVAAPAPRILIACDKFKGAAPALRLSAHPFPTAPRHNQLSVSTLSFPPPPAPSRINLSCCCCRRHLLCSRQFAAIMLLHRHLPNCRRRCATQSTVDVKLIHIIQSRVYNQTNYTAQAFFRRGYRRGSCCGYERRACASYDNGCTGAYCRSVLWLAAPCNSRC